MASLHKQRSTVHMAVARKLGCAFGVSNWLPEKELGGGKLPICLVCNVLMR